MCIIQFGSTGIALILEKEIKYLLSDVVGTDTDFFCFGREAHKFILLVLDQGKRFVLLVST